MAFWQQDVPDTAWSGHDEDPIPVLLGRYRWSAFLYRWFAVRPLDGKTRTNNTWREGASVFWTKTKGTVERTEEMTDLEWRRVVKRAAPWPAAWHLLPRWKQALYTRLLPTAWIFSHVFVLWVFGLRSFFSFLRWEAQHTIVPLLHFLWWAVTLWW